MQPNPFRPGAGSVPPVIAGRKKELSEIESGTAQTMAGSPARHIMFYGLRGVGKTVLLTEAENVALKAGLLVFKHEVSEGDDSRVVLAQIFRKAVLSLSRKEQAKEWSKKALGVLKSFTLTIEGVDLKIDTDAWLGEGDSGNLSNDLADVVVSCGDLCKQSDQGVCIVIDEVQYLSEEALRAIIETAHRVNQKNYPIFFICAGLPQVAALSGDAKSYAERLFDYTHISELGVIDDFDYGIEALTKPFIDAGFEFKDDAALLSMDVTGRYPYFIQELGSILWPMAHEGPVTINSVNTAKGRMNEALDHGFFRVRIDRSTELEKIFMKAMTQFNGPVYEMARVAKFMGREVKSLGPLRAGLIKKGFVYSPSYGKISFTVHHFEKYLIRNPQA